VPERVLVLEDNRDLAENIGELLADEGYETVLCEHSEQLEQRLGGHGFDLALVDIGLRGNESGLELVPKLRQYSPLGEIVLMTGNATLHTAMQAIRSGVHAYLPKPFAPEELLALGRRALAQVALKRERQALSDRLAVSEALYRGVVETVETCILGVDDEGVITFANRFAQERLGGPLERRTLASLQLADAMERVRQGQTVRDLEVRHQGRTLRWTLNALHATNSRLARLAPMALEVSATLLAVGIDITDRLELERRSANAQAMAAIGTLTTGLAHEIRNPLNAAKLQLELLQRRAKKGTDAELAARLVEPADLVRGELERLSKMLDEFLSLARPGALTKVTFPAAQLLESVLTMEGPVAQRAGILLRSAVVPAELCLAGEPDKLKQVLLNLIRNAIDSMSERGHGSIEVRAEQRVGDVLISVLDDGPGLAREMVGNVFEAFTTTKPGGTGLGLSIVQKIVHQHGGNVELVNRPEGGTNARFSLPR
jgi:signal transduction histidine kinase